MPKTFQTFYKTIFFLALLGMNLAVSGTANAAEGTGADNVFFNNAWIDYDIYENNQKGMRIHAAFQINNFINVDSYLGVYFFKGDDKVMGNSRDYRSTSGQLAVYRSYKPAYDQTVYDDLSVFIPYDAIPLGSGKHELKLDLDLIYQDGDLIAHLTYLYVDFTR